MLFINKDVIKCLVYVFIVFLFMVYFNYWLNYVFWYILVD